MCTHTHTRAHTRTETCTGKHCLSKQQLDDIVSSGFLSCLFSPSSLFAIRWFKRRWEPGTVRGKKTTNGRLYVCFATVCPLWNHWINGETTETNMADVIQKQAWALRRGKEWMVTGQNRRLIRYTCRHTFIHHCKEHNVAAFSSLKHFFHSLNAPRSQSWSWKLIVRLLSQKHEHESHLNWVHDLKHAHVP